MENIRVVLAAVSLGIGVLLLIIAFIRSLRKKAPATANWVFSGLFVVVAAVLWIRGSDPLLSNFPSTVESSPERTEEALDSLQVGSSGSKNNLGTHNDQMDSYSETTEPSEMTESSSGSISTGSQSSIDIQLKQSPRRKAVPQAKFRKRAPRVSSEISWEDRIFSAIDASFDWIEDIFEQYAIPVAPSKQQLRKPELPELPVIEFPDIRFNSGTAELTSDSQVELKILATRLTTEYPKGMLEVQAYVDSSGPEAFNFVLTQARADAVRDLLIAEGMTDSRIIAKGYGTGEDPELADSRIEFIVRR